MEADGVIEAFELARSLKEDNHWPLSRVNGFDFFNDCLPMVFRFSDDLFVNHPSFYGTVDRGNYVVVFNIIFITHVVLLMLRHFLISPRDSNNRSKIFRKSRVGKLSYNEAYLKSFLNRGYPVVVMLFQICKLGTEPVIKLTRKTVVFFILDHVITDYVVMITVSAP